MSSFYIIYFCTLLIKIACSLKRLDNYTVYEVTAFNARERAILYHLYTKNEMLVFINGITNEAAVPMDIIVDVCCTNFFETKLQDNDIEYFKVKKDNLIETKLDFDSKMSQHYHNALPDIRKDFQCWESIMVWVELKLKTYPFLTKINIAKTFEKREVFALKISTGKRTAGKKDIAVFLMGGEDGRDHLSPAILINLVDYILEKKFNFDQLVSHYDFYILPILNPDGYEYSMTKDWAWSRNRRIYFPKKMCARNTTAHGVNIDRNWFFSKDIIRDEECDPVYAGSRSLSESETAGLADLLNSIALNMLMFINVRGFDRLVTIPYGYKIEVCNNYPVLLDIISSVHQKIKDEYNATFFYGTGASYFYNFSGNVADWVKRKLNTPIVYTFYLKDEDYIFPSAKNILPMTNQFSTMIKEILMLGSSLYSPLFNNQNRIYIQITFLILNIVTTLTYKIYIIH